MRPDSRRLNRAGRSCVQQSCSFLRWLACIHRSISEGIHKVFSRDFSSQLFRTYATWGSMQTITTTLLLLVSLWVPIPVCSLIFGSSGVRRKLAFLSEYRGLKDLYYTRFVFSVPENFLPQAIVRNVSAAALLDRNRTYDPAPPAIYLPTTVSPICTGSLLSDRLLLLSFLC